MSTLPSPRTALPSVDRERPRLGSVPEIDDVGELATLLHDVASASASFLRENERGRVIAQPASLPRPDGPLPESGAGASAAVADYLERFGRFHSRSTGPRYFGFVTGGVTPAALAADWLVSTFDQNVATERHSIAAGVEAQAVAWMCDLLDLPAGGHDGLFTTGATSANLVCLATAREWAGERVGANIADEGVVTGAPDGLRLVGCRPHSSVVKVAGILGIGRRHVERVASLPGREAVDPAALEYALAAAPGKPAIVCASAGTVDTGDFDDLTALAQICAGHGAWLHVDAAFGAFLRTDPERRELVAGLELADSIAVDCHKWLNVPHDCGLSLTRSTRLNERAFTADAPYVPRGGAAPDYMNRGLEQSRRFRALPVWMTLTAYGRDGVSSVVRRNCDVARDLGSALVDSGLFALVAPVRANIVCFRPLEPDGVCVTDGGVALARAANARGRLFLTPSMLDGEPMLRLAVCNWSTDGSVLPEVLHALVDAHVATVEGGNRG